MKNFKLFLSTAFFAAILFSACEPHVCPECEPCNHEETDGVLINGVVWAPYNVDAFGKFAASPESFGMLYQWNRQKAWNNIYESVTGWDDALPEGTTWETQNDPCPDGWRVPVLEELEKLFEVDNEWTTQNGVYGRKFVSGNDSIFLPAAGSRNNNNGTLSNVGASGNYWSSTNNSINLAFGLGFSNDSFYVSFIKTYGLSVRCVAE